MTYPRSPVARSYFIHTFGCQMNESDSQRMGEALARAGWRPVGTPDGADLVLVNTCVIPYTRGREVSRSYAEIVGEVTSLVAVGVREITLIGQNVNSYAGGCTFAALIRRVAAVPGLLRIRFTTSHPMDLSDDLVRCFAEVPQLMPHFHLPVQHGADSVLERMRRRYTIAEYERRIAALPAHVALTSDIICGFPGETDDEHRQTVEFLRRTGYDK